MERGPIIKRPHFFDVRLAFQEISFTGATGGVFQSSRLHCVYVPRVEAEQVGWVFILPYTYPANQIVFWPPYVWGSQISRRKEDL